MDKKKPVVGENVYVGTHMYIEGGDRDIHGGLGTISKVEINGTGINSCFVSIKEIPGRGFNWDVLMNSQEKWKAEFGTARAYPDPDYGG